MTEQLGGIEALIYLVIPLLFGLFGILGGLLAAEKKGNLMVGYLFFLFNILVPCLLILVYKTTH